MNDNHHRMVKEQLWHMLLGTLIFVTLASLAVGIDLAASYMMHLGVSSFTHQTLELTAHCMLILDVILFLVYLATSSFELLKEMFR